MDSAFLKDVRRGLSQRPRSLPSKYFYDARGDELFQRIMALDEYYPTRAEESILQDQGASLLEELLPEEGNDQLIVLELGAGDGSKTRDLFLTASTEIRDRLLYVPNDISGNVLNDLEERFQKELPWLHIEPLPGDHTVRLPEIKERWRGRKALLFLGGNIGNYDEKQRKNFLDLSGQAMKPGDRLLIGFDQRKDPRRIEKAYNDPKGVTKAFNLNLLERMNRELGADFDPEAFMHYPVYDPSDGEARSYLLSIRPQRVRIEALEMELSFEEWEPIFMERSKKFTLEEIEKLAAETGFQVRKHFRDANDDFVDSLWVKA